MGRAVSVAAVNGPAATVVSGDPRGPGGAGRALRGEQGVRARRLPVDYASHGAQVEGLREEILAALAGISAGSGAGPDGLGDDRASSGGPGDRAAVLV